MALTFALGPAAMGRKCQSRNTSRRSGAGVHRAGLALGLLVPPLAFVVIAAMLGVDVLSGLAGAMLAISAGGTSHGTGLALGLQAVISAIAGGSGSSAGALMAARSISVVEAAWSTLLPIEHRDAAIFALVALALVFRPREIDRAARSRALITSPWRLAPALDADQR